MVVVIFSFYNIFQLYNFPKPFLKQIFDDLSPARGEKMEFYNEEKKIRTIASFNREDKFVRTGFLKKLTQTGSVSPIKGSQEENQRRSSGQDFNDLSVAGDIILFFI